MKTEINITADDLLELEIQESYNKMLIADNDYDEKKYSELMRDLVLKRTPEQVKKMELEKGLI